MSSEIVVKESDLQELLEEVRKDLSTLFKSNEEPAALAKAEPEEEKEKEAPAAELAPKEEMPKDAPADGAPPAAAMDPIDDSALTAPDEVSPEASAEAAPEPMAEAPMDPAADPAMEAAPSIEALQAEYEKLPEHELMMHLCAAHAACLARGGMAMEPAAEAEAEHAALGEPPPAEMGEMGKGEVGMGKELPTEGSGEPGWEKGKGLKKSEADLKVEELTSKLADQEKALIELVNFVTTPVRKSVKNISDVAYLERGNETEKKVLSKAEVHAFLKEKTKSPDLKKSDRELINRYYDGNVPVEKLEHLLKD